MRLRHPQNTNLHLHHAPYWKGYPVLQNRGPLVEEYLEKIDRTLVNATQEYSRVSVFLVCVRFPSTGEAFREAAFISNFSASLKAQLAAEEERKRSIGQRIYPCQPRFVWVREQDGAEKPHFHIAIILNKDAFHTLGDFGASEGNMAARITKAVASSMSISVEAARGLAHFPENPVYYLDVNSQMFGVQRSAVFRRISYFAKAATKKYGTGGKNFGCSRY